MPLKTLARQSDFQEREIASLRDYVQQFSALELLNYQTVTGTITTGSAFVRIRHSLGRAYQAGIIAGASSSVTPVVVQTPEEARLGGTDITQYVCVLAALAVAADHKVTVLVY